MYIFTIIKGTIIWNLFVKKGGVSVQKILSRVSGFLAFVMLMFFGTSAFATEDSTQSVEQLPDNDLIGDYNGEPIEDLLIEKFVDEDGKTNELITDINNNEVTVSLLIDGKIEQQSILNKETNVITGFSEYGENEFVKDAKNMLIEEQPKGDMITVQPREDLMTVQPKGDMISPMAVGYYSQVATRASVPNAACNKRFTAYLYEKSTTIGTSKHHFAFSKGDLITSVIATIIGVVVLKSTLGITLVKEMLVSIGIGTTTSALAVSYKGAFHVRKEIKDYNAKIYGSVYFTNKITKEYLTMYNNYTGKSTVKYLGQHVSAYGKPTGYQTMLSSAIVNWSNATKCK